MKLVKFVLFLVILSLLTACGAAPAPDATPTAEAPTVVPTVVPTAVPTLAEKSDPPAPAAEPPVLPDGDRWMAHFKQDLLPFWDQPAALGDPVGKFPTKRCDNGTAYDARTNPCPEIDENGWLNQDLEYTVSRSRQAYAYGVAFHLTGNPLYLEYAKAGVDYLRENAYDRENGGTYHLWNGMDQAWQPDYRYRNPQELAYSLLGISFYYYLTRDPELLPDITSVKDAIFDNHFNPELNALQWMVESTDDVNALDKRLVAQLDNLNAYMVFITPLLPEPEQSAWKADMVKLANLMIDEFYSEEDNLFFLTVNDPADKSLENAGTDFGHSIKAMWMIYHVGLISDVPDLVSFAQTNGPRLLEKAYHAESGSWASGYHQGGELDLDKDWWVYNELNQFAMEFGLQNPALVEYLPQTSDYYFRNFVDHEYGEVWTKIDGVTHQPKEGALPKAWPWKNAYHSFEHALMGYITAQQMNGQPVTLYYAFKDKPAESEIQPYFLRGDLGKIESSGVLGVTVYKAEFQNIR
jgi:mannose/cellobiose epimerase-like protein (N-acyl-D-glucosamine 2-epimerase family)